MELLEKLSQVQNELKAPKSQYNKFGGFNYRSCEDILEAVKPLLVKHKLAMRISDDMVAIGDRIYVKATVTLTDTENKGFIENTAFAREEESKKGMDGSQVTGASSSYARKYALNGLFLIDDTKDSDATNTYGKDTKPAPKKATAEQVKEIKELTPDETTLNAMLKYFGVKNLADLTEEQAKLAIARRKESEVKNEQDSANK